MYNLIDCEVIDTHIVYEKFPKGELILALFNEAKEEEEFESFDLDSENWYFGGIGINSTGSYYVMDMIKVFYNLKTGDILLFPDYDNVENSYAFTPFRAEDSIYIEVFQNTKKHVIIEKLNLVEVM